MTIDRLKPLWLCCNQHRCFSLAGAAVNGVCQAMVAHQFIFMKHLWMACFKLASNAKQASGGLDAASSQ